MTTARPASCARPDQNVTFGTPRHRGVEGGAPCADALEHLVEAVRTTFRGHDPLVQALALHYHLAAMHPFLDGNGRTARALEALMLQRLGVAGHALHRDVELLLRGEGRRISRRLPRRRAAEHDLTPFLMFALKGVELQCRRLFAEIRLHVVKALFRNTVTDLFGRLKSPRKRVMSGRHVQILNLLLDEGEIMLADLVLKTRSLLLAEEPAESAHPRL